MKVGDLVRLTHHKPEFDGLFGIVMEEYVCTQEMGGYGQTLFRILFHNCEIGEGWNEDSWQLEVYNE